MSKQINNFITFINLLGSSAPEKQALEILVKVKEYTENKNYLFNYDFLVQKRLTAYLNKQKSKDIFTNISSKPLKKHSSNNQLSCRKRLYKKYYKH